MAGNPKFVIRKRSDNRYQFELLASNGQPIATSDTYVKKVSALKGIESVRRNAATARIVDRSDVED